MIRVRRRSVRAILIDENGRLVLIKRTRPGRGTYESQRDGPEFSDPSRGTYEVDRVDLHSEALTAVDLKPAALKEYILANRDALLVEVGLAG
ncbi:MAG: hypothetical protein IRY85_21255 [Micromonosporaceae bacterium]|nr:hypothetical protein [Micromonosporaceae bacterium]